MTASSPRWAILAGGGTAGHVLPGIAIATALVASGHRSADLLYVGSERGLEKTLVPQAGFELELLPGRGIKRSMSPRAIIDNIGAITGLLRAIVRAWTILGKERPSIVVSLGGFAAVPCVLAAIGRRVPIVVAEQNAVPGAANRLAGRFAKASAVSFPHVGLPREVYTGNPVRPEIRLVLRSEDRLAARGRLDVADGAQLLSIFGGSLGARSINNATLDAIAQWAPETPLVLHHIIGDRDFDDIVKRVPRTDPNVSYRPIRYEADMASVYAASDLMICRSGATTVAELSVVGCPSILIPLPGSPGDHQTANARFLADQEAAVLVPDAELSGERLRAAADTILGDVDRREAMGDAASSLGRPDAAAHVAQLIEEHARG
jgi:UDP-N-acetylglucosamine--N-acetylmuramyl-(pentapeptide) pyrophosphoryl-undecaprenol N-acetylglucosamine transferase